MLDNIRESSFTTIMGNGLFKTDGEAAEVEMEKTESAINNGEGMKVSPLLHREQHKISQGIHLVAAGDR